MRAILSVSAVAAAMLAAAASADTVIDTIPQWDSNRSNGWDKICTTILVPGNGDRRLNSYTVGLGTDEGREIGYVLRIYQWDRNTESGIGAEIWNSGALAASGDVQFIEHTVGVNLIGSTEYAIIVDWDNDGQGSGISFIASNVYADGYANFTNGDITSPWSFNQSSGFDIAFRAVFKQVPAPGALALLGALGLLGARRRRIA